MTTNRIETKHQILAGVMKDHCQSILIGAVLILAYGPSFVWMWNGWFSADSYYNHGILIPFVTVYLIWQKRDVLNRVEYEYSPWGWRLIVTGLTIYLFSLIFRINSPAGFSMIFVLMGSVLHYYGRNVFKEVWFPLVFLVFMVPVPSVVIVKLSFSMKLFAAKISAILLNEMRIPAIQEGSIIKMRHAYVIVDDVCSGLRSLISLTALAAIFAYWMKSSLMKRMIVFISSIPIAIITNVCRIILLCSITEIWGPKYAVGFIHDLSGFLVFGLAFILLFSVVKLIE